MSIAGSLPFTQVLPPFAQDLLFSEKSYARMLNEIMQKVEEMRLSEKLKTNLWRLFAVVLIVVAVFLFLHEGEQIEDTNGPDDYSLATLTDGDILAKTLTSSGIKYQHGWLDGMVEFSSDKFSGVYELLYIDILGSGDFTLDLYDFEVTGGNFKMCVINNDQIVAVLEPENGAVECLIEDLSGMVRVVIAGESAAFTFKMTEFDCDYYGIG